jgi:hypothetical protein
LRQVDAWPATPKDSLVARTFIHTDVLQRFQRTRVHLRAVSVAAFLKTIEEEGEEYGNMVRSGCPVASVTPVTRRVD